jgi:DNA-binding HxlR family transcriptional regulator
MVRMAAAAECPMDWVLRILMGPWTTYILWVLLRSGPSRFGEIKRQVPGISAKVLTERLRMLESTGIVDRRYEATIPPRVTYSLTRRGEELRLVLSQLNELARQWRAEDGKPLPEKPVSEKEESPLPAPARDKPRTPMHATEPAE